jgi:hypothetical protein
VAGDGHVLAVDDPEQRTVLPGPFGLHDVEGLGQHVGVLAALDALRRRAEEPRE